MPLQTKWCSALMRRTTQTGSTLLTVLFANLLMVGASAHQKPDQTETKSEAKEVNLIADGELRTVETKAPTVRAFLVEQETRLDGQDRCSVPLTTALQKGMTVIITRIRTEIAPLRTALPFPTRQKYSYNLPAGKHQILQPGKNGERIQKFLDIYKDGVCTGHKKISETVLAARPQIELLGTRGMTLASRGGMGARRIIEMIATGYSPAESNNRWGGRTASGMRATFGVVAVDPRVIRLGTHLFVEGYGPAIAGDTGGKIKGNRIDLCHSTRAAANAVGRRRVRVMILD